MMFLELWPYRSAVASPDKSGRGNLWGTVKGIDIIIYLRVIYQRVFPTVINGSIAFGVWFFSFLLLLRQKWGSLRAVNRWEKVSCRR